MSDGSSSPLASSEKFDRLKDILHLIPVGLRFANLTYED